jgi:hypothetical protein
MRAAGAEFEVICRRWLGSLDRQVYDDDAPRRCWQDIHRLKKDDVNVEQILSQ